MSAPSGPYVFVTVGTQLHFDRLVAAMDALAPDLGVPVVAQTGPGRGGWANLDWSERHAAGAFDRLAAGAQVIVGHAGIGTLLTARTHGRPAVLMPRDAALNEHRNDHQRATARALEGRPGVAIAWGPDDLAGLLRPLVALPFAEAGAALPGAAAADTRPALIARLRVEIARG